MNDPDIFKLRCAECGEVATSLCDYPIKFDRNTVFLRDYNDFKEMNMMNRDHTCTAPLCDSCKTEESGADMCKYHAGVHAKAKNIPNRYQSYIWRARSKEYKDMAEESE